MSDQSEIKRTRRAKRRAEQADKSETSSSKASSGAESGSARAEAEAEAEAASASAAEGEAGAEPKRAKRKAKATGTEEIRDRNRRLRERAAAKRRATREREREAPVRGLDASEMVDDAVSRSTQALGNFLKRNFGVIQWLLLAVIVGGIGWQIYSFRHKRETSKSSDELAKAVESDLGRIASDRAPAEPKELRDLVNPVPQFANEAAREKAAREAYSALSGGGTAMATLAKLGLAGVAYDAAKYDEARKLYDEVKSSELAGRDADVKARATEGAGLALEAKGDKDGALRAFHELENSDMPAFAMLGLYHQARVRFAKGEQDKAKELVKKVRDKLEKQSADEQQQYLEYATGQLQKILDPVEYAKSAGSAAGSSYTPEQLEALKKQILKDPSKLSGMLKDLGKAGKGSPAPTPAGSQ